MGCLLNAYLLLVLSLSNDFSLSALVDDPNGKFFHLIDESRKAVFPYNISPLNSNLGSPVDIITSTAIKASNLKQLQFLAYNDKSIKSTITNSGHGVSITLPNTELDKRPQLSGGFLESAYVFENIHYHWGAKDYFGTEHFINGESFSLEGHMVTFKKTYGQLAEALKHKDGVVVLTFFAKIGEQNDNIEHLLQYIPQIQASQQFIEAESADSILWFLPDVIRKNKNSHYYAYPGSLTTDPYTESVSFIILPVPITISKEQLGVFRQLRDSKHNNVLTNRRELQPLRDRPLLCASNIKWTVKKIKDT